MNLARQMEALRESAAWIRSAHVTCLRLAGEGAFDLLDRICPVELHLRDGQIVQTLLLDPQGVIRADLMVARDDESYFLLLEGMTAAGFADHVAEHAPDARECEILDMSAGHELVSLHGPFAWEALAELLGPDVIGLPYMTFFNQGAGTCFRAGKTGEFGFDLLVPHAEADELTARLEELAPRLDLVEASLEALDLCALENWFFNMRREGTLGLNPLELQLQWRLTRRKEFVGSTALAGIRSRGLARRVTTLFLAEPPECGRDVLLDGAAVGTIINAGTSFALGRAVALALLDLPVAHAGIGRFRVDGEPARSVAPPVLNNLSLFVSPQIHCYADRQEIRRPERLREIP